ncbi:MAG TPA: hypothetical protein VGB99_08865 [Acidobacteriota bacterium]
MQGQRTPTLHSLWAKLQARLRPVYPRVAIELSFDRWSLLRGERTPQGISLRRARSVPLAPEAITLGGPAGCSFDLERLRAGLSELLEGELEGPHRVTLLLPDAIARATLLEFESLPARREERIELLRWKLKRITPFKIEDARISYQELAPNHGHRRLLAVAAPTGAVLPLEQLLESFELEPVLVDLSTPNLWNLMAELATDHDLLLINRDVGFFAVSYFQAGKLCFYRCKPSPEPTDVDASDYLLQEIRASQLYLEERLELPSPKDYVVRDAVGSGLERALHEQFGAAVESVDPHRLVDLGGCAHLPPAQLQRLLPLMGALQGR